MDNQQEKKSAELSPEEQLDELLAKFLAEDTEMETAVPETSAEQAVPVTAVAEDVASEGNSKEEAVAMTDIPENMPDMDTESTEIPVQESTMPDMEMAEFNPEDSDIPSMEMPEKEMPEMEVPKKETQDPESADFESLDLDELFKMAFTNDAEPDPQQEAESTENHNIVFPDDAPVEEVEDSASWTDTDPAEEEAPVEETIDPDEEDDEDEDSAPPPKRRPKNPNRYGFLGIPHMITTVIWLMIVVFIGVGLGKMIWEVAADMLAFGRESNTVTITITAGDDLDDIAQKLYDTGLIKYKGIFKFYGKLAKAEQKVEPGTYYLNTLYDYNALVKKMASYEVRAQTTVVIPEGYTCAQIFRLLEKKGICSAADLNEAAMNMDLSDYWFLAGIDQSSSNCLEGFLFPDTYDFYLDYDATKVLQRLLDTFEKRFTDSMQEKLTALNLTLADMMRSHGLPESYISSHEITIRELVIVASMIEKETAGAEESYYIASVIYNRLTNPGEYPYLNIDATLVYVVGHSPLTAEDLKLDSPYNTYLYKGLVPGPIANPGVASLNAALSPESTEYYFYALDPSVGTHKFFKTYKAHLEFLESLRNGGG